VTESTYLTWPAGAIARLDHESSRYRVFCADRLIGMLHPAPGDRLLELAAAGGAATLSASQAVGPHGRVTAVDTSERLLAGLESRITQFGIANVDLHVMDGGRLDFRRDYFQHVVCSLGLDRFSEPRQVLADSARVLRAGGRVGCSTISTTAFQPQLDLLRRRLAAMSGFAPDIPWAQVGEASKLRELLTGAGFVDVETEELNLGYHLVRSEQWWEVVECSPLRNWLAPLTPAERQELQTKHLEEIAGLAGADGLWLDVPVVMATGRKPGRQANAASGL
jgi:ubiquinone/menaquinone biosynthesis C-methylase UbiE